MYNESMKNLSVILEKNIYDAILWCQEEFGHNNFSVQNQFPSKSWAFTFIDPQHATHFALKWSN